MNTLQNDLSRWSTEALLQRRALGPNLEHRVHVEIEAELRARGITPPPIPTQMVDVPDEELPETSSRKTIRLYLILTTGLIGAGFATAISKTLLGPILIGAIMIIALIVNSQTKAARTAPTDTPEDFEKAAKTLGLDEVMTASASGDLQRLSELIAYKKSVNESDIDGATALIYATRNGHVACVKALLDAGAKPNMRTKKGSTALSIATKFEQNAIAALLRENGAR
jgi:ankyrin repeat protein